MQISGVPPKSKKLSNTAVTIGVFDGVHAGHQKLINTTIECAKRMHGKSVLITFKEHPDKYFSKDMKIKLIKKAAQNLELIKKYGINRVVLLDLKKHSSLTPEEFVVKILIDRLGMRCLTCGKDFIFGKGGKGNVDLLKKLSVKYGFNLNVVPDLKIGKHKVSSTLIRNKLKAGNIKMVERLLNRKYVIHGEVIEGRHIGHGLGFPTANIKIQYEEIPARGVWAVTVKYGNKIYAGAANIGFSPTLKNEKAALIEVFIFNFKKNIYGKKIEISFEEHLRDERKFKSQKALVSRINKDVEYIKKRFAAGS